MHMNYLTPLLCTLLLVGCGGGGGGYTAPAQQAAPPPPPTTSTPVTPSFDVEYSSTPDATIIDAVSKLEIPNCTLSIIQQMMIVDLNNDSNNDILVFVMCTLVFITCTL